MNTTHQNQYNENILEEVRRVKRELAARFDFDIHRIFEELRREQAESGRTYVQPPARKLK